VPSVCGEESVLTIGVESVESTVVSVLDCGVVSTGSDEDSEVEVDGEVFAVCEEDSGLTEVSGVAWVDSVEVTVVVDVDSVKVTVDIDVDSELVGSVGTVVQMNDGIVGSVDGVPVTVGDEGDPKTWQLQKLSSSSMLQNHSGL